ncbi:MAG: hypothetical protein V3S01_01190 [Dehalococcoidia bacterium]
MSYAAVGLGKLASDPTSHPKGLRCSCPACAGVVLAMCNGGESAYNCPDEVYCPSSTWSNATYARVKGRQSWRAYNELRVRHVLHQLLAPVGIDPHGMEKYKYDTNAAAVDPELPERVARAAYNWHQIYPKSRWAKRKNCVPTEWSTDGFYSCWVRRSVDPDPARVAAIENAMGKKIGEPYRSQVLKRGHAPNFPGAPADLEGWWRANHKVVDKVPGSEGGKTIGSLPVVIPPGAGLGDVLTVKDGRVVAGAWLTSFLDLFAPSAPSKAWRPAGMKEWKKMTVQLRKVDPSMFKVAPLLSEEGATEEGATAPSAKRGSAKWIVVGLAAAGIGIGVWKWRKS